MISRLLIVSTVIFALPFFSLWADRAQANNLQRWASMGLHTSLYGKAGYTLTNTTDEAEVYRITILEKESKEPLDTDLWRSDVSRVKDDDVVELGPGRSKRFRVQLRVKGKYWVCTEMVDVSVTTRNCIPLISNYEEKEQ